MKKKILAILDMAFAYAALTIAGWLIGKHVGIKLVEAFGLE